MHDVMGLWLGHLSGHGRHPLRSGTGAVKGGFPGEPVLSGVSQV